jgi:hypothetical protein
VGVEVEVVAVRGGCETQGGGSDAYVGVGVPVVLVGERTWRWIRCTRGSRGSRGARGFGGFRDDRDGGGSDAYVGVGDPLFVERLKFLMGEMGWRWLRCTRGSSGASGDDGFGFGGFREERDGGGPDAHVGVGDPLFVQGLELLMTETRWRWGRCIRGSSGVDGFGVAPETEMEVGRVHTWE